MAFGAAIYIAHELIGAMWWLCSSSHVSTQMCADLSLGQCCRVVWALVSCALFVCLLVALSRLIWERLMVCVWAAQQSSLQHGKHAYNMVTVKMGLLTDFISRLWKLCLQSLGFTLFHWNMTPDFQGILVPSVTVLHWVGAKQMSLLPCMNARIQRWLFSQPAPRGQVVLSEWVMVPEGVLPSSTFNQVQDW